MERVDLGNLARTIFERALASCDIEQAMERSVRIVEEEGVSRTLFLGQKEIDLNRFSHIRIFAIGKAAPAMLDAFLRRLPQGYNLAGILISSLRPQELPANFAYFPGGHPMPNEASFAAARAVLQMLHAVAESGTEASQTLSLFLISGGASAMMEIPRDPSITLEDTVAFSRALVHSGASIREINCIRKHFSDVKGGRLAVAAGDAVCISIFISDVPHGHLDTIASGPTLPDTSTVEECHRIIEQYNLRDRFPDSVRRFFESPDLLETPKPHELSAETFTLLEPNDIAQAARLAATQLGFDTYIDNTCDDWDYRAASEYLLNRMRILRRNHERICLISVGEVSVPLRGPDSGSSTPIQGVGGRNQHFALYIATLLKALDSPIAVLSAGSDGVDGNSPAAGAVITEETLRMANTLPLDQSLYYQAQNAIHNFDSFNFFQDIGGAIMTGPTGNNLRDLRILLVVEPQVDPVSDLPPAEIIFKEAD